MNPRKAYQNSLPKKRMGAGALFFDSNGHILLVKPTYKPGWEIPGGVVEHNESPKACCQREIQEELGLQRPIGKLLVIDYSHETDEKLESLMFVFDGGVLTAADINAIQLPPDELSVFRFFSADALPNTMTTSLKNRVRIAWQQKIDGTDAYLENQQAES